MSRLLESIRIQQQQIHHLPYHQTRLNIAQKSNFQLFTPIDLAKVLSPTIKFLPPNQSFKCRVLYSDKLEKIEFHPYTIKPIDSLKKVYTDTLSYTYKWENRTEIQRLLEQKGSCADILIIKKGKVTDSSYCTILFFDGVTWWTPNSPLLKGVERTRLLAENKISETEILEQNISKFQSFKLVNAMRPFEVVPAIPISHIQ